MMKIAGQESTGNFLPIGNEEFEDNNVINISGSYNFFGTPIENMTVSGKLCPCSSNNMTVRQQKD